MNNIDQQVVSLELAKQLKEAGYAQQGNLFWVEHKGKISLAFLRAIDAFYSLTETQYWDRTHLDLIVTAPLASEIGEKLQSYTVDGAGEIELDLLTIEKRALSWCAFYQNGLDHEEYDDYMANVLAKLWLYLKQEGLIK